jgi:hypothetical protein
MINPDSNKTTQQILNFLKKEGLVAGTEKVEFSSLSGDGSSRLFFIIKTASASYCGVLPDNENSEKGLAEAYAAYNIGTHLKQRGIPVPSIHGFDPDTGFILFEDLGRTLLYDYLLEKKKDSAGFSEPEIVALYKEIIETLLVLGYPAIR